MFWAYLRMLRRRALRWGIGGGITVVFFVVAMVAGAPEWLIIASGVVGALVGSVVAHMITLRLLGEERPPPPPAPRGRGTGKRGSL